MAVGLPPGLLLAACEAGGLFFKNMALLFKRRLKKTVLSYF
jgi:hypothetical protein